MGHSFSPGRKEAQENWDEEFEREKATYALLRPLQGMVIPQFFGEIRYDNTKALLLLDIEGTCLAAPEGGLLELEDLRRLLNEAFATLAPFRILQDDVKLDNFHLVDNNKIMFVDLERVSEEPLSDEDLDFNVKSQVNRLVKFYENHQYYMWKDGLISVDT